jgi:Txe/YoeB family toxin of Txe-Axe toxin-antitoxin module
MALAIKTRRWTACASSTTKEQKRSSQKGSLIVNTQFTCHEPTTKLVRVIKVENFCYSVFSLKSKNLGMYKKHKWSRAIALDHLCFYKVTNKKIF